MRGFEKIREIKYVYVNQYGDSLKFATAAF